MKHLIKSIAMFLLLLPLLATGCGTATPTEDPAAIYTQSAMTVQARLTETALAAPATFTPTITPAITDTPRPTNTPLITDTPAATNTPFLYPTLPANTLDPCDDSRWVADIGVQDGDKIPAGSTFLKTWRVKNTGDCTWTTAYQLIYGWGGEGTNWNAVQPVNFTAEVVPGGQLDVSVVLTAPSAAGYYGAFFRLRNANGYPFGEFLSLYIQVP
ncbi:MAG: hypothetical protein FJZ96_10845 [Chloroflexi bacterium]|nr:hypothetical protein [Chloroflexota bacterium]